MALLEFENLESENQGDWSGRESNVRTTQTKRYVSVGDLIAGKYLVEGVLGVGGMAFVLSARHLDLDQHFALKFLNADFLQEKGIGERFMREARAACKIRNQHVAQVHDVGTHEGAPFIVMEHLVGKDLAAILAEQGALPIQATAEYIIQACEALAAAHSHGIVHRDIKPENLFLVQHDGPPTLKLLDFGISKAALGERCSTLTGRLMLGTPFYMSPEQIRVSAQADERSDLWSLGAVLYELLTGVLPFQGDTVTELCAAVLETEPTPIQQLRPEVPETLCAIVSKCMAKNASERWSNVAELAQALLPFAPGRSIASAERSSSVMKVSVAPVSSVNLAVTSFPPIATTTPPIATTTPPNGQTPANTWLVPQHTLRAEQRKERRAQLGLSKATVLLSFAFAALGSFSFLAARRIPRSTATTNASAPASATAPSSSMVSATADAPPESTELSTATRPSVQPTQPATPLRPLAAPYAPAKNRRPESAHATSTTALTSPAPTHSTSVPIAASVAAPPANDTAHVELGY
jgi:eukaryotic-like serine/threonine-protein kinase